METIVFVPAEDNDKFGWLCVASSWASYDKPERVTVYYPITTRQYVGDCNERLFGQEVHSTHDGRYVWYVDGQARYVYLLNGGQTTPIKSESAPIPAPKTRCPVRYERGRWQKYTARGWQTV